MIQYIISFSSISLMSMSEARDRDSSSATYTPPQGKYTNVLIPVLINPSKFYAKQKHLGCKKGEANQKQQLSDYKSIHSYTCD